MPDENIQFQLEQLRQQGETNRQTARLAFYGALASSIFGFLNTVGVPLLMRSYHLDTVEKVDSTKAKVVEVKADAATAAVKAEKTEELARGNMLQWKAYNTKEPGDMEAAHKALGKLTIPE